MTTREKGYVYYVECCESLRRALRILRDLRGTDAATAVHHAALNFAVVEYAKPYCVLGDARMRNRRAYRLAPPDLSPEDLALHRQIIALRDRLLVHEELALKEAMELPDGQEAPDGIGMAKNATQSLVNIDAMIGLIERTLVIMSEERARLLGAVTAWQTRRRLTAKAVKVAIQGAGMLAGVLGIGILCIMGSGAYHALVERGPAMASLFFVGLLLGTYMIYVAYLVTFQYSPLAVRHVCGALACLAWSQITRPFLDARMELHHFSAWMHLAYFASLFALYYGYRAASNHLNGFLFSGAQPPASSGPAQMRI